MISKYSPDADIVLDKRENVTNEGNLIIEDKATFVEVETATHGEKDNADQDRCGGDRSSANNGEQQHPAR